jgi:hypothetical protein
MMKMFLLYLGDELIVRIATRSELFFLALSLLRGCSIVTQTM